MVADAVLEKTNVMVSEKPHNRVDRAKEFARSIIKERHKDRGFHNLDHFEEAVEAVEKMSQMAVDDGIIKAEDAELLVVAVALHDLVQGMDPAENEWYTVLEARAWMYKNGFSEAQMNKVGRMILMTTVEWDKDTGYMRQKAEDSDNILDKLIADGDLINNGAEWETFESRVRGLWKERGMPEDDIKMWEDEKKFLEERHFFTKYAEKLAPHLEGNKQRINDILAKKF